MNWLRRSNSRYKIGLNFNYLYDWNDYRDLDYGYYDYENYLDNFGEPRQLCRSLISCRTLRPSCRTLRPTCSTLRPTCRTLRPSCSTLRPTCRTLRPTCRTLSPTCRAFRPSCRTLRPPSCRYFSVQTPPPGQPGPTQPEPTQPGPTQPAPQPPTQPQCPFFNPPPACNYVYVSKKNDNDFWDNKGFKELGYYYNNDGYNEEDIRLWWLYNSYLW